MPVNEHNDAENKQDEQNYLVDSYHNRADMREYLVLFINSKLVDYETVNAVESENYPRCKAVEFAPSFKPKNGKKQYESSRGSH